ncbi:hypothetical protein P4T89_09985 [Bacillus nakamurai]|uniref:Uncharacterized protein n=1 Tax=Bacillus nakamurai TaxID=1793963 RepID=A0A150F289_9BACI|nr:hypothetical protein [Bacillus nakamurai]KXZ13073.1 hypothetical protein AXI58_05170 [Bacillus nakamurai]MED1227904.1 hypothetical protein [Bacillus nakamurai]
MYYFYEMSTLNHYDWSKKEYKTIEHHILPILKKIENMGYVMYAYFISHRKNEDSVFALKLKTDYIVRKKYIYFIETFPKDYKNTITAHENIILLKRDSELKDVFGSIQLEEKTLIKNLLDIASFHIEITDSEILRIGSKHKENIAFLLNE